LTAARHCVAAQWKETFEQDLEIET
jgi:hypothetical protein